MAFISASDEYGEIDLVMFPKTYERNFDLERGRVVLINAKVERRINEYQLIINKVERC